MRVRIFADFLFALMLVSVLSHGQTRIEVQEVKKIKPTGSLSTCGYQPTEQEKEFLQKVPASEQVTGSFTDKDEYRINGKTKLYVSWFGIVRAISTASGDSHNVGLLIQQKFFDGMTDCHIMLVSKAGAGDFAAKLTTTNDRIPLLSLVRIYGTVLSEENGVPQVAADYLRVWPWMTFTFADLGPSDRSNPAWAKYCRLCKNGRVYKPYPNEDYYKGMLGDPKDFASPSATSH